MDEFKKRTQFLEHNYLPFEFLLAEPGKKIFLGDKHNRICRFCGKSNEEVSFNDVAHAIPEFTGNKTLIAYYECDSCNRKFSTLLESHMANYMNLSHTLSQVKGKKGVPSFKTVNKKQSRVDIGQKFVNIEHHPEDRLVSLDEQAKTINFKAIRPSYIPIAVYKCLTKMALSIMPETEISHFKDTISWINEEDHKQSDFKIKPLNVFFSYFPGVQPLGSPSCVLLKRKNLPVNFVPYMLFLLTYSNFAFQIYIPLCSRDKEIRGKEAKTVWIPTFLEVNNPGYKIGRKLLDFSSFEIVKGEVHTASMGYERLEDLGLEERDIKL